MNLNDKTIAKIKALLNLADTSRGATEEEAKAAMQKAGELMAKYGLEMADLSEEEQKQQEVEGAQFKMDMRERIIHRAVYRIIAQCFECKILWDTHYVSGKKKQAYYVIADPVTLSLLETLIPYLYKTILSCFTAWLKANDNSWSALYEKSFSDGFASGCIAANKKAKEELVKVACAEVKYALVVADMKEKCELKCAEMFPKMGTKKHSSRTQGYDSGAYSSGAAKGAATNLNRTVNLKG
jgi:hypothetical protein